MFQPRSQGLFQPGKRPWERGCPCLRQKLGISLLIKTGPEARLLSWQQHKRSRKVSKDNPKRKTPFFILKNLSNKQQLFFSIHKHLNSWEVRSVKTRKFLTQFFFEYSKKNCVKTWRFFTLRFILASGGPRVGLHA